MGRMTPKEKAQVLEMLDSLGDQRMRTKMGRMTPKEKARVLKMLDQLDD